MGLEEPEMWPSYAPLTITLDGVRVETTCPVLTDPFRATYLLRLTAHQHLDRGLRTLRDVDYLTFLESNLVGAAHAEVRTHGNTSRY